VSPPWVPVIRFETKETKDVPNQTSIISTYNNFREDVKDLRVELCCNQLKIGPNEVCSKNAKQGSPSHILFPAIQVFQNLVPLLFPFGFKGLQVQVPLLISSLFVLQSR